jgi:PBS lyase HEAT-like repeat
MASDTPTKVTSPAETKAQHVLTVALCALITIGHAYGQPVQNRPGSTEESIAHVKSGEFSRWDVENIVQANAVRALPALKEQFGRAQDPLDKGKLASALIKLGDHDETYWQYLIQQAQPVIDSDAPTPLGHDAEGKTIPGPSPEFTRWAERHKLPVQDAGGDAIYIDPPKVLLLAMSGDPRAIPLLRQGLKTPNDFVKIFAAVGLAEMQDKASIPAIIQACKAAPAESAKELAEQLVYFDDIQAQDALDAFLPAETVRDLRDARAHGLGPLGYAQ